MAYYKLLSNSLVGHKSRKQRPPGGGELQMLSVQFEYQQANLWGWKRVSDKDQCSH